MPKVLCFDFDDTLLDDKSNAIRIEEVCDAIVRHQAAGGMILFVTDKKAFSIHDMHDRNEPIPKLLSSMNDKGVNIRTNDSVNFSIIANSDTTGVVTNLYTNYLLVSPELRGFGFKIIDSNLILEPTEPCLGKILWKFNNIENITLEEGENTPLEIEITVNGNSVKINTDLKSLLEISDGKFLHILLGLIGNGYIPDNLEKREGIAFSIENIRGCEKIAIEDILLIDDKRTNLEKFDSMGGKILFPDTPYLQDHVVKLIEKKYKFSTFNTADSVGDLLKFIDGAINRGIFDEHVRAAWELKKSEFKEKLKTLKKAKRLFLRWS
jgi:hypothetical protein